MNPYGSGAGVNVLCMKWGDRYPAYYVTGTGNAWYRPAKAARWIRDCWKDEAAQPTPCVLARVALPEAVD